MAVTTTSIKRYIILFWQYSSIDLIFLYFQKLATQLQKKSSRSRSRERDQERDQEIKREIEIEIKREGKSEKQGRGNNSCHFLWGKLPIRVNTTVWKNPQKYISVDQRYFYCIFTHMTSIYGEKKFGRRMACEASVFIELHHFMKKE